MRDDSLEPMTEEKLRLMEERAFDERVISVLEKGPDFTVTIPEDFAARVAAKAPVKRPVSVRATSYGRASMWIGLAALLAVLMAVSASRLGQTMGTMTVECVLLAQFVAIVGWLSVRRWREG
ncbi:MAG: hypothetical protein PW789_02615 [Edaphobacter sp.]|uniref:hypothetical protein n=1 Tax=Edaphobacter sp. TaxID=1934404 RepID=UPI0023A7045A|nr:hypothetical protein [Edaphobacter sp.]MDE1175477.1 hypothetical protein [Edaphobacter sp.]